MNIYQRVVLGIKWHAFESILYEGLLNGHRLALYFVIGGSSFGIIGSVFAAAYALIFFSNLGLNDSIITFFSMLSTSQQSCKQFFARQLIPNVCVVICLLIGIWFIPHTYTERYSLSVIYAGCFLYILESIRMPLKAILQLSFFNKLIALVNIAGIILYIAAVWLYWLCGMPLTPTYVILLHCFVACMHIGIFIPYVLRWFLSLPSTHTNTLLPSFARSTRIRFFAHAQHLCSSQYMSNIIVPCIAQAWGFEYASIVKLLVSFSHCITTFLRHTVGFSAYTLFSYFKHAHSNEKKAIFRSNVFFMSGMFLASFALSCIFYHILITYNQAVPLSFTLVGLLLFALIFENCFTPYEAAYLSEEQPERVLGIYLVGIGTFYLCTLYGYTLIWSIIAYVSIRSLSLVALTGMLLYRWRSDPH